MMVVVVVVVAAEAGAGSRVVNMICKILSKVPDVIHIYDIAITVELTMFSIHDHITGAQVLHASISIHG